MKIGIDIRAIGKKRTGDETVFLNLVRGLSLIDRDNYYFLYTDTDDAEKLMVIQSKLGIDNPNFQIIPVLPGSKALWTFWSLARQAWKDAIDILHVQYITPRILPRRTKLITTIHDISFERYPEFISKADLLLLKAFIPGSLKRADRVIAVSEFTRKEIISRYELEPEKVVRIYNGGADGRFWKKGTKVEDQAVLEKHRIKKPFLFYIGTLQPRKNVNFLIDNFALLKERKKNRPEIMNLQLVIGGKRNGYNYDHRIDRTLERIRKDQPYIYEDIKMIGYASDDDLPGLYRSALVSVFPSLYEGFGLPIVESMACGTPVLCADSHCFPEIGGGAAELFRQGDEDEFIKKLDRLVSDERLRIGCSEKGMRQASSFSWEKNARETLALYEKTLLADSRG